MGSEIQTGWTGKLKQSQTHLGSSGGIGTHLSTGGVSKKSQPTLTHHTRQWGWGGSTVEWGEEKVERGASSSQDLQSLETLVKNLEFKKKKNSEFYFLNNVKLLKGFKQGS